MWKNGQMQSEEGGVESNSLWQTSQQASYNFTVTDDQHFCPFSISSGELWMAANEEWELIWVQNRTFLDTFYI